MKNLKQLIGITTLIVVVTFSIVVIACNDLSGDGSFVGNWRGRVDFNPVYSSGGPFQSTGTINFTTTDWIFRSQDAGVVESGTYDLSGSKATLWDDYRGTIFGTAYIKGRSLFLTITDREWSGSSGEFTRY